MIISLRNADIYERDAVLFKSDNWLNSSCINYCLRKLEINLENNDKIGLEMSTKYLMMDPSVVSFLQNQCIDEEEHEELGVGIEIHKREWVFLPITNSDSFSIMPSHWSVLVFDLKSGAFYHFDSHRSLNQRVAYSTAVKVMKLMGR